MFGGSDRKDALPGIQELIASGKLDQMRAAGVSINPDFEEIELESAEAEYLVDRFFDLSAGRSGGGWGITPLTWQDFAAYCLMRKTRFTNWEITLLQMLDGEFCKNANRKD